MDAQTSCRDRTEPQHNVISAGKCALPITVTASSLTVNKNKFLTGALGFVCFVSLAYVALATLCSNYFSLRLCCIVD